MFLHDIDMSNIKTLSVHITRQLNNVVIFYSRKCELWLTCTVLGSLHVRGHQHQHLCEIFDFYQNNSMASFIRISLDVTSSVSKVCLQTSHFITHWGNRLVSMDQTLQNNLTSQPALRPSCLWLLWPLEVANCISFT